MLENSKNLQDRGVEKFQMYGEKKTTENRKQMQREEESSCIQGGFRRRWEKKNYGHVESQRRKEKDESLMNGTIWSLCPYDSLPLKCPKITLSVSAISLHCGGRLLCLKTNFQLWAFLPFNKKHLPHTSCSGWQLCHICLYSCRGPLFKIYFLWSS